MTKEQNSDQAQVRREKLAQIREMGLDPYPIGSANVQKAFEASASCSSLESGAENLDLKFRVAGRLSAHRGRFLDIRDDSGKIQLDVCAPHATEKDLAVLKLLDLGDVVMAEGFGVRTRRGEATIRVQKLRLISKSLRPVPGVKEAKTSSGQTKRFTKIADTEMRYRKRHLDVMTNPETMQIFRDRSKIFQGIRAYLDTNGFLEVDTPILQPLQGGATAKPFVTHHNALDMPLFLRVAPELYLKRLLIGGMDKIYEMGPQFRNEGVDTKHNPEYTMLEVYETHGNAETMMALTENLVASICKHLGLEESFERNGKKVDLRLPWPRHTMLSLVSEQVGEDVGSWGLDDYKRNLGNKADYSGSRDSGEALVASFDSLVHLDASRPQFVTDFPLSVSPLAQRKEPGSQWCDRFELMMGDMELANGFSELNDPDDQRSRLEGQAQLRKLGDEEALPLDEDFIEALEYGMPPAGGLGIGIDRLTMVLTGVSSIREVILFPLMRPVGGQGDEEADPKEG